MLKSRFVSIALTACTLAALTGMAASCSAPALQTDASAPSPAATRTLIAMPSMADTAPRDYPGINNAVAFHDGFVSGSFPKGDAGFDTLAAMGVKTIISVDGAVPDVQRSSARGIRYIHLPIGYQSFDDKRRLVFVRATRDALRSGSVYIHCHHGKHRSAPAAAAVAVSLGWSTPEAMIGRMKVSGTAPDYKGLYASAAESVPLSASVIDAVPSDFPSVSRPSSFIKAMIELDEVFNHLAAIEKAGWMTPANHPDLVPAAEAARLADLFRGLVAGDYAKAQPADFLTMLMDDTAKAQSIEDMIVAGASEPSKLSQQLKGIGTSCNDCHAAHRN